jgi:hypothetical protein
LLLLSRVVVLHEDRDDPCGNVVEVYDHAQPATGIEQVLPVEALTARARVLFVVVGNRDGRKDEVEVLQQPAALSGKMEVRAGVEDDFTAVRSLGACARWLGHTASVTAATGASARVKRSASSLADRAWRYRSVVVMRE